LAPTSAGLDLSLDQQVRPADSGALRLTLIITNYSPPKGEVTLTGKDMFNQAQTEEVEITANGEYVTNEYWKSIDDQGVDCTGTYTIEITQPRWGVVWKTVESAFTFDTNIRLGDGFTTSWFIDSKKQIVFSPITGIYPFEMKNYGHVRWGEIIDAEKKISKNGIQFLNERTAPISLFRCYVSSGTNHSCEIYSCSFISVNVRAYIILPYNAKFYNCSLDNVHLEAYTGCDVDVYDLTIKGVTDEAAAYYMGGTLNKTLIYSCKYAFLFRRVYPTTWSNVIAKDLNYLVRCQTLPFGPIYDKYLKNVESDNWTFDWIDLPHPYKIYRQYEFDAHCQDKNGNDLSGVSVVGEYISPYGQAFSVTTDANGDIATQNVDRSWYEQATGNTENLKTPLKVTYKKPGYQTVVKYYPMDEKTKDRVVLHKAVGVFLDFGRPVVNLKKNDPENKNVMVL